MNKIEGQTPSIFYFKAILIASKFSFVLKFIIWKAKEI